MGYKKLLLSTFMATVMMATALAFGLSRPHPVATPFEDKAGTSHVEMTVPTPQAETSPPVDGYVRRNQLWPQLHSAFGVIGDRLEKAGRERLVMTGTLTRAGAMTPNVFTLVREFPDRLRLEEQEGVQRRVSVYDRSTAAAVKHGNRSRREADDIETLVFDTAERFFTAQAEGAAMRHLGDRFRLDDDGSNSGDASAHNSSYNLYEVTDEVNTGSSDTGARQQTKVYALNSNTFLLERVRYETTRDGEHVRVEVRLGDWRQEDGQMTPRHIERRENDRVVFSLDINSVVVAPRVADGAFNATRSN